MVIMTKNIDIDIYIYNLGLSLNPEHFRVLLRKKKRKTKVAEMALMSASNKSANKCLKLHFFKAASYESSVVCWDHFSGRYPQQLARSQQKTSKLARANELQKNASAAGGNFPAICHARIIDGMILVLRLKGDQKMFSDVGESLSGVVLQEN